MDEDEISRCYRLLGLEPGSSLEKVQRAYRDLVQVWHPDRFANNERQQSKAQEQLKEINLAYEFLLANAAVETTPTEQTGFQEPSPAPAPREDQSQGFGVEPEEPKRGGTSFWNILSVFVGIALVTWVILWWRGYHSTRTGTTIPTVVEDTPLSSETNPVTADQPQTTNIGLEGLVSIPSSSNSVNPGLVSGDILESMVAMNNVEVVKGPEGVILHSKGSWAYIQSPQSIRPPLVIRTRAKTDLKDIRLYYGLGRVIFNWESNPAELRIQDPLTTRITPVPGQGFLSTKEWHDLVWEISTNSMKVSVDGELRFEGKGYYGGINAFPGIGPEQSQVTVNTFAIESPHSFEPLRPPASAPHLAISGDILSSMVPVDNVKVTKEPDGTVLIPSDHPGPYLKSQGSFRPPFVIRTRAKTDSREIRVYCGPGSVILSWADNPSELRVRDPLTVRDTGVSGRGLIRPNVWHDIAWAVTETGMRVSVDGQVRFQNRKDYRALDAWVGIGPAWSKVTVDYFSVGKQ